MPNEYMPDEYSYPATYTTVEVTNPEVIKTIENSKKWSLV